VSASAAAGVDRRAGSPLRLLPERNDDPGRRPPRDHEEADRSADPHRDERAPLPLRYVSADPDRDPEGRCRDGEGWEVAMTEMLRDTSTREFSRKKFLGGTGALVVGFSFFGAGLAGRASAAGQDPYASLGPFDQSMVDSWIVVNADNTVTLKAGKVE